MINSWYLYRISYSKLIEAQIELGYLESIEVPDVDKKFHATRKDRVLKKIQLIREDMGRFEENHPEVKK